MKKLALLTAIMILGVTSISQALPLKVHSFILETSTPNSTYYAQFETGKLEETDWYSKSDIFKDDLTSLGFLFEVPTYSGTLYVDIFDVYNGTPHHVTTHMDATPYVEIYGSNNYVILSYETMSPTFLTEVTYLGVFENESTQATMYLGEAPPVQNPVPEPATIFLFGLGLLGLTSISKRRKKKK